MKEKTQKLPTVADIARLSGTNRSTVSRILNNKKGFSASAKCRLQVLEIAKKLKYQPKSSARSLATNKSYCIGVIVGDAYAFSSPFFIPVISEMTRACNQNNYKVVLMPVHSDGNIDDEVSKAVRSGGCDGFYIGSGMIGRQTLRELSEHSIPVVTTESIDSRMGNRHKVSSVIEEIEPAYMEMASELHRLGHRRIAAVINLAYVPNLMYRLNILKSSLKRFGIEINDNDVVAFTPQVNCVFADRDEAKLAAVREMARLRKYSAIVAMSDLTALGVCDAFLESGIEPGKQIAVAGYDNLEETPFYPVKEPFLATIDPHKSEKGRVIAETLLEDMSHLGHAIVVHNIKASFVPRRSLCPAIE